MLLLCQAQIMLMCQERKDFVRLVDYIIRALNTVFIRVIFLKSTSNVCHINCVKVTLLMGPPAFQCGSWRANKCAALVAADLFGHLQHWWYLCSPCLRYSIKKCILAEALDPLHVTQNCYKICVCGGNYCHININTVQNTAHCFLIFIFL